MVSTRKATESYRKRQSLPYLTRAKKRNNEEVYAKEKEFLKHTPILFNSQSITIEREQCYPVLIAQRHCLLRIDKLWNFKENVKMEGTLFTLPTRTTSKCYDYGEDELKQHQTTLNLHRDKFQRLITNYSNSSHTEAKFDRKGSLTIKRQDVVIRKSNSIAYIQLGVFQVGNETNMSASILMKKLRINQGSSSENKDTKTVVEQNHQTLLKCMIMSYEDYCMHRKLKKALETGVAVPKVDAWKYHVVTDEVTNIFFTRNRNKKERDWKEEMDNIDDEIFRKFSRTTKKDTRNIESFVKQHSPRRRRRTV